MNAPSTMTPTHTEGDTSHAVSGPPDDSAEPSPTEPPSPSRETADSGAEPAIEILDATRTLSTADLSALTSHAQRACALAGAAGGEVRVRLVRDDEMAAAHEEHCGVPGTTDVITFDLNESPNATLDADLLVCLDEAARQAERREHTLARELLLYILHGALHCLGEDDKTEAASERMHAREDEILEAMGALRDYSIRKLQEIADSNGGMAKLDPIVSDPEGHALMPGLLRALAFATFIVASFFLVDTFAVSESGETTVRIWVLVLEIIVDAVIGYFLILELPASVAQHAGEKIIHAGAGLLRAGYFLALPLRKMRFYDIAVKRLAGATGTTAADEIEDDLLSAVSEGEREGTLGETEREMIEAVVELRTMTVEEVMTPRTEIEGLELTDDLKAARDYIHEVGHSRIPVYRDDLDHLVGILYAKDLLAFLGEADKPFTMRDVLREPMFLPETRSINEALLDMRSQKIHLAIVLDEYGGTAGLITIEDILEEIVGEIEDEYEPEHETPPAIEVDAPNRTADVDARAYLDDANDALKPIEILLEESEDYETVGGWVMSKLGHIPVAGETFSVNGYDIEVLEAEPTRVRKLRFVARPPAEPASEASPEPVTFYTCGPTVYDYAHIGNFRSFLAADVLRRWLESPLCERVTPDGAPEGSGGSGGYRVTHVMNLTDVGHMVDDGDADGGGEDKMEAARERLLEQKKSGRLPEGADASFDPNSPWDIARFYIDAFIQDALALGMKVVREAQEKPELLPRPTNEVRGMLEMILTLLDKGCAYVASDGVAYFDTQKFPAYGKLSGNTLENIRSGAGGRVSDAAQSVKKHPADFMLWKPDTKHLMKWDPPEVLKDSPDLAQKARDAGLREGYPGWHLECSVMARKYLGAEVIDLHSGGEDNIFPHHECEIAQSCCATGKDEFARYWFHARFLQVEGAKMSKSAGNFFTVRDLMAKGFAPDAIRLELIKTHYRSNANFTEQGLKDSKRIVTRWRTFLEKAEASSEAGERNGDAAHKFARAMNEDLNIAGALGVISSWINATTEPTRADADLLREFDGVLGVLDLDAEVATESSGDEDAKIDALVQARQDARKNRDFAEADRLRDELTALGVVVEDTCDLGALRGRFIVFEGPDGSGKSTQFSRLKQTCRDAGVTVTAVREPGGTAIGERIRSVLLDPDLDEMSLRCEMMLYMASRAQLVEEVIRPALSRNELVMADRFVSSTIAYQGHAGGFPIADIMLVAQAAVGPLEGGCWPDLTLIFDVDAETAASRLSSEKDRMEQKSASYHAKVREGYLAQAREAPGRFAVIDATADVDEVTRRLYDTIGAHPALTSAAR
ncbi:cysS [Symbiodinium necroappetens]|uniref:Cysteine--tRNA ligase n=1 Tax=Symbiodinium necroappetens TaxID=1628268 RepID=A0A812ZSX7_9DINO|nr:cysS [Symbiodinium necroappetens]